jgi:hypothetical protein
MFLEDCAFYHNYTYRSVPEPRPTIRRHARGRSVFLLISMGRPEMRFRSSSACPEMSCEAASR